MNPEEITGRITELFPNVGIECIIDKGHAVAVVPVQLLASVFKTLNDNEALNFDMMMDLSAVDWLYRKPRFDVVYHFYSTVHNHRLRVKVTIDEEESLPTATKLWMIANPMEREVWDMYGIKFTGHPSLERLLLYEEFKGHP